MKWHKEDDEYLIKHYHDVDCDSIAKYLKRSSASIRRRAYLLNITNTRFNHWLPQEDAILKRDYGVMIASIIAKTLNRSIGEIRWRAKKLQLNGNQPLMASIAKKQYSCNDSFFCLPTIRNCYWAGFIAADGCIDKNKYRLQFGIHSNDLSHMKLFVSDLQYTGPIYRKTNYCSVQISSDKIIDNLRSHFNITPQKSLTLLPPLNLDNDLVLAFIIGYIDGDGCIHKNIKGKIELSCLGTLEVLKWIQKTFDILIPPSGRFHAKPRRPKPSSKIYIYRVTGERAVKIIHLLRRIEVPFLQRKWCQI